MATTRRLLSGPLAVVTCTLLVMLPADCWAADYQGNQSINRPASLIAPEPDAEIAVYLWPEAGQTRVGYAEGWVQAEFVLPADAAGPSQQIVRGRYLGNRPFKSGQKPFNPQAGARSYSQRQN